MQPATAQLESTKWYENGISALCGGWVGGGDNEDTEPVAWKTCCECWQPDTAYQCSQNGTSMYFKQLSAKILIERQ